MGKANDEKKQVNMDESTAAREERDRDIRALMALMEEGDLSALRFDDGNVKTQCAECARGGPHRLHIRLPGGTGFL